MGFVSYGAKSWAMSFSLAGNLSREYVGVVSSISLFGLFGLVG